MRFPHLLELLISSHIISSHTSSHFISYIISPHPISSHLILSHLISSHHLISTHLISSQLNSSHLISSQPKSDVEQKTCFNLELNTMNSPMAYEVSSFQQHYKQTNMMMILRRALLIGCLRFPTSLGQLREKRKNIISIVSIVSKVFKPSNVTNNPSPTQRQIFRWFSWVGWPWGIMSESVWILTLPVHACLLPNSCPIRVDRVGSSQTPYYYCG